MYQTKICRFCHEEFRLRPGKLGRINVCEEPVCQWKDRIQAPEPEKVKGWTAWENKHTPIMTITNARDANRLNSLLNRHGYNACLPGISNYSLEHDEQVIKVLGVSRQYTAIEQLERDLVKDRLK